MFFIVILVAIFSILNTAEELREDANQEIIVYFNQYMKKQEIADCLMPLSNHFQIKQSTSQSALKDFVVVTVNPLYTFTNETDELADNLKELACVKTTGKNKIIKANYMSFLNLHTSNKNTSLFNLRNQTRTRSSNPKEEIQEKKRRELFLKGDYSNLYDELELWKYHGQNLKGKGIKIAIVDSGISKEAEKWLNIAAKVDFTGESQDIEASSHGTFIASVIGSRNSD